MEPSHLANVCPNLPDVRIYPTLPYSLAGTLPGVWKRGHEYSIVEHELLVFYGVGTVEQANHLKVIGTPWLGLFVLKTPFLIPHLKW